MILCYANSLYTCNKSCNMTNETKNFVYSNIKDSAVTSYNKYQNHKPECNISKEEMQALLNISKVDHIVIQGADKGNAVVIVEKDVYIQKMTHILSDTSKFVEVKFPTGKQLRYILNQEEAIRSALNRLLKEKKINTLTHEKLWPVGSSPGIMYGNPKVHKPLEDGNPKYRPVISAIRTPGYKIAKFLVPLLTPITSNEFTAVDSFTFSKEIADLDCSQYMCSLDVESLFTNLPVNEAIDICVNELYTNKTVINNLSKPEFKHLLELSAKDSFFLFNKKFYKQVDGVAMGGPLGPSLANGFLSYYEKLWLATCPDEYKPTYYRRYVDDIFVLFPSKKEADLFLIYMNEQHTSINFTMEGEIHHHHHHCIFVGLSNIMLLSTLFHSFLS